MRPWTDIAPDPRASADWALAQADLACILDHALSEREAGLGTLPGRLGLSGRDLARLSAIWFPGVSLPDRDAPAETDPTETDIATLLLWRAGLRAPETPYLAAIIARRTREPRHLWEDLGLPGRAALDALMARHFPQISAARPAGMRWKRFLYRQICAQPGHALCPAPTCDACDEHADCFAPA